MKELELKSGATKTVFQPDGKVAVIAADGTRTLKGSWRSDAKGAEAKESVLRYDIAGAAQPPVPVKYSFNKTNQLTAVIPAAANGGADSEECVFLGQILIDDAHDLIYSVLKPDGTPMGSKITVYGDLHFTDDSSDLVIEMKDGTKAEIKGEKGPNGVAMLKAEKNLVQEFKANDLLRVIAFTRNQLTTSPTPVPIKAQSEFVGKWDVNPDSGGLVFLSKITGDLTKPDVTIAFAGVVKGVTVGFAYFADQAGTKLVFNMKGEHRWNASTAKWELSMGHSGRKFQATFDGKIEKKSGDQTFVLSGKMNLELEQGKSAKLDLKVEGAYQFNKNNKLVFIVDVATSNGKLTYDLSVEGTFALKNGSLTFTACLNSQDTGGPTATIELAFKGNQASLIKQLSLVLDISPDKVTITFEFEMRMHFVNGVLVKDQPKPIAAAAPHN